MEEKWFETYNEAWQIYDKFSQCEDYENKLFDVLLNHVSFSGKTVFEMGCGTGKYTKMLSPYSEKWYANDISPLMIEKTKEKCADLHNITYITSSAENTQLPDESIDIIFAAWAYTASEGREITLRIEKEFHRILKSSGSIWLLENYLEGEFTDMRGIRLSHDAPRYVSYEYGYELVDAVPVHFRFSDLAEAKMVCGFIFGDNAIQFFDKKGTPILEDMVSVMTKRKQ